MTIDLHKVIFVIGILCFSFFAKGQEQDIKTVHSEIQGFWLSQGDSVRELLITADSITTYRFRLNGVSACGYKLVKEPCEKIVKFPSATGIYISEHYRQRDVCCALSLVSRKILKIIYPDGTEYSFINEKMLPPK